MTQHIRMAAGLQETSMNSNTQQKAAKLSASQQHSSTPYDASITQAEPKYDIVLTAFRDPQTGHDFTNVPAQSGKTQPTKPLPGKGAMIQRFPMVETQATVSTPIAGTAEPETADSAPEDFKTPETTEPVPGPRELVTGESRENATSDKTTTANLIVEDGVAEPAPGQMRKSEFLAQLRTEVTRTAEAAMAGTGQTTKDCPYLEYWFGFYSRKDSAHIERAIHKYAPETASAATARDYIPIVASRVRRSVEVWARTGEITGVPEGLSMGLPGIGMLGGLFSLISGIGSIFFKARAGGARKPDDPRAVQVQLGEGRPLEGGVRSRMESAFGMDFSHVRTHTDNTAAELSTRFNARAFTVGKHVAFGAGEYQPGTLIGDTLIAHEMAHVVQQSSAGESSTQMKGGDTSYNSLEEDADRSAVSVVASLFGGTKDVLSDIAQNATPCLRSGLRLSRCTRGSYKVTGLGRRKKGLTASGGNTLDMAIAMLETENMKADYKYGDGKKKDAANFGIFKQNWLMIRKTKYPGKKAEDWNIGAALNSDLKLDIEVRHKSHYTVYKDMWWAGHRGGESGLKGTWPEGDINRYKNAVLWIKSQIDSDAKYQKDDTRFWVKVPAV